MILAHTEIMQTFGILSYLSYPIFSIFTLCNMWHKQFFYHHLLWLLKMQTKAVEFCTPLFSYAFKRNVDTPLTANPWFEKFHKSTASLKSSWNGPKYIACADIRSLRVLTVACSKQILSWVSAAAIWYNLIPD